MKLWIAGLLSLSVAVNAQAGGFISGNELYAKCTDRPDSPTYFQNNAYCAGYVAGIVDVIAAGKESGQFKISACFPGITVKQVMDVVVRYLEEHPQERHYSAGWIVGNALAYAFPCR